MKKLILIAFLSFVGIHVYAQTMSTFRTRYTGFGGFSSLPMNVVESHTADQYLTAGIDINFFGLRGILFEIDNSGLPIWGKRYASATHNDLIRDSGTDYAVCGQWSGDGYLAKLSSTGTKVFSRRVTTGNGKPNFLKVKKVSDGGYIVAGTIRRLNQEGVINDSTSAFVAKFSSTGGFVWQRSFRFYKEAGLTNVIRNDASFVDCIEVDDGYIFVGRYEVDDVININSNGNDMTPDDAIILKTQTDGTIVYLKQIDLPSTSDTQTSKFFSWLSKTTTGEALVSGTDYDGFPALLLRLPSSGGWVAPTWRRKYSFGGLFTAFEPSSFFQSSDGNYVVSGLYVNLLTFRQFLIKINPTDYSLIWSKLYAGGLPVSPSAAQSTDGGYFGASGVTGIEFFKTNTNGVIGDVGTCTESEFTVNHQDVSYTWADPFYKSFNFSLTSGDITATITDITVINTIVCTQETPLPIELTYFNASCMDRTVVFEWQTASESNNDFFTIEASQNGYNFQEIKQINGAGNSSTTNNYRTEVNTVGTKYYRLKQTDYDGQFTYSDIIYTSCSDINMENDIIVYPNPASDEISINFPHTQRSVYQFTIYNLLGQPIYSAQHEKWSGEAITIPLNVSSGQYIIRVAEESTGKQFTPAKFQVID
jgi:hypothetical protein